MCVFCLTVCLLYTFTSLIQRSHYATIRIPVHVHKCVYTYICISSLGSCESLYVFVYKTSPFVDCIMCMYSWQKAAYDQIKSINQLFMYISVYLFEISLCNYIGTKLSSYLQCTYHDCDIHVFII